MRKDSFKELEKLIVRDRKVLNQIEYIVSEEHRKEVQEIYQEGTYAFLVGEITGTIMKWKTDRKKGVNSNHYFTE